MGLFDLRNKRNNRLSLEDDDNVVGSVTNQQSMFPASTDDDVQTEPDTTPISTNTGGSIPKTFSAEDGDEGSENEPQVDDSDDESTDNDEAVLNDSQKTELTETAERLDTAVDAVKEIVSDIQNQVANDSGEVPESTIKNAELAIECLMRVCEFDNSTYIGLEDYSNRAAYVISRGNKFISTGESLLSRIKACLK